MTIADQVLLGQIPGNSTYSGALRDDQCGCLFGSAAKFKLVGNNAAGQNEQLSDNDDDLIEIPGQTQTERPNRFCRFLSINAHVRD